jgi:hypothetical protein
MSGIITASVFWRAAHAHQKEVEIGLDELYDVIELQRKAMFDYAKAGRKLPSKTINFANKLLAKGYHVLTREDQAIVDQVREWAANTGQSVDSDTIDVTPSSSGRRYR